MNAELRRNLWLQMTGGRIAVGVSLVFTLLVAALVIDIRVANESFGITRWIAIGTYVFVVLLWGGRQAAGAVVTEVHERTWDWQRLSSVGAWSMTIGKLVGVTSLTWVLGLICMATYAVTLVLADRAGELVGGVAFYLGLGLFTQAFGLLLSMMRVTRVPGYQPANITLVQLLALLAVLLLGALIYGISTLGGNWYGQRFGWMEFSALTFWFFGLWCVAGAYRRMRRELQHSATPWFWFLFLVSLSVFAFGVEVTGPFIALSSYLSLYVAVALVFYVVLLFEPKSRGAVVGLFRGQPGGPPFLARLEKAPLWLLTLGYLIPIVLLIAVFGPNQPLGFIDRTGNSMPMIAAALFLFLIRDLMIMMIFLNQRDPLQPELVAFIVWFVLYAPLPAIFLAGKVEEVLPVFWPDRSAPVALMLLSPAVFAVLAGVIAWLIWRRNRSISPAPSPEQASAGAST